MIIFNCDLGISTAIWELSELNTFKREKRQYLPHYKSDISFKGTESGISNFVLNFTWNFV